MYMVPYSIISAVVGKRASVVREELEAYIKKNEAALAALQSDQEEASSDTDERLAAAALALAATKEALQVRLLSYQISSCRFKSRRTIA